MGLVVLDMSMSLDGFVAGTNVSPEQPMGERGERLHDWMFAGRSGEEARAAEEAALARFGSVVMGHRTFELGEEPWGDDTFRVPCFVVTHRPREPLAKGPATFTFVTEGVRRARELAAAAAGDRDVMVMGGAGSPGSSWLPACWTSSGSTWCPCCSAAASGCSTGTAAGWSSWGRPR